MRDLKSNIAVDVAVPVKAISAAGSVVGNIIDMSKFNSACFLLVTGNAYTDGTYTLKVEEGDDAALADAAVVDSSKLICDDAAGVVAAANAISRVGYIGSKQYVRATVVATGVTTGAVAGVLLVKGDPLTAPL